MTEPDLPLPYVTLRKRSLKPRPFVSTRYLAVLSLLWFAALAPGLELNSEMMKATVCVQGGGKSGSGFILGLVLADSPPASAPVLVTARHVLDGIVGDSAILHLHLMRPDSTYGLETLRVCIRAHGKKRYLCHPDDSIDVAVLPLNMPQGATWGSLADDWLLSDSAFDDFALHPGDEVFSLGYPRATAGPGYFPILRSAYISSYPTTPIRRVKHFYLDMPMYHGCSGGPVYIQKVGGVTGGPSPYYDMERDYSGIIGLVSDLVVCPRDSSPLTAAVVQPSCFIRDVLDPAKAQLKAELRSRSGRR